MTSSASAGPLHQLHPLFCFVQPQGAQRRHPLQVCRRGPSSLHGLAREECRHAGEEPGRLRQLLGEWHNAGAAWCVRWYACPEGRSLRAHVACGAASEYARCKPCAPNEGAGSLSPCMYGGDMPPSAQQQ